MKFAQLLSYTAAAVLMSLLHGWLVSVIVQIGFWKGVAAAVVVYGSTFGANQVINFLGAVNEDRSSTPPPPHL